MKIKMPFKIGGFFYEKEVEFVFKLSTLEEVCELLKIEFWQLFEKETADNEDVSLAMLWGAYLTACKSAYKKPKYHFSHAVVWDRYMSQESRQAYVKQLSELMGKLKDGASGGIKKK